MAYGDFKDLPKGTAADQGLYDKSFKFAKNLKYDDYQQELASMVYRFLIKTPLLRVQINLQVMVLKIC